jgi:hypothetical protein
MWRRCLLAIAGLLGTAAIIAACYDLPEPDCGFRCGPDRECPDNYTCSADDDRCHLQGSDPGLVCGTIDAAPLDAPVDGSDSSEAPAWAGRGRESLSIDSSP